MDNYIDSQLVVDEEDGGLITSIRHHVWLATDGGLYSYDEARTAIIEQIADADLKIVPEGTEPTIDTCRGCGCTDEFACDHDEYPDAIADDDTCQWADDDKTLCTRCQGSAE